MADYTGKAQYFMAVWCTGEMEAENRH